MNCKSCFFKNAQFCTSLDSEFADEKEKIPVDVLDIGCQAFEDKANYHREQPSLAQLMTWESEGGCEAACKHGCWVESDGICKHGEPSWLLKLGLI